MISEQFLIDIKLKRDKVEDFSQYPFCLNAIKSLDKLRLHPSVTYFVGENGSGKSTLLEAVAVAAGFNPEGGSKNFGFSTRSSHSILSDYIRLSRGIKKPKDGFFLRAESFFNVATEIEALDEDDNPVAGPPIITYYGGQSLHEQSHGESFMSLLLKRFSGKSLYILDEPEAALSPSRQMTMLARMHQLVAEGCQFIIATHSPIVMAYPDAQIFVLGEQSISETSYEDTEHYKITRQFLNNHTGMLTTLLDQEPE